MENFDIEKLERQNIYAVPEGFFVKMQRNVLKTTESSRFLVKKGGMRPLFNYVIAASVLFILGMVTIYQFDNSEVDLESKKTTVISEENSHSSGAMNLNLKKDDIENNAESSVNLLAAAKPKIMEENASPELAEKQKPTVSTDDVSKKAEFEGIMAELSRTEIADMGKGAEQDVYLDLYY